MKLTNKAAVIALGIAVTAGIAAFVAAPAVSAYRGDYTKFGPNHTEAREAAMEKVMKSKDFTGWKKLMTENSRQPGVLRVIDTQAEFDKFAEAWVLGHSGKIAEAAKIRAELGLGQGGGRGMGGGSGMRGQNNGGNFVDANKNGTCDRME